MTSDILVREAIGGDVEAIIRLHEADSTGHGDAWTSDLAPTYRAAFDEIAAQQARRRRR